MVAGPADAGKTTLMRALASRIPSHEAFVVLEESRELGLHTTGRYPWAMSFEAREGHGERGPDGRPEGQITLDDLIAFALRMSAPRIIVGEVRSHEIVAMLKAMRSSLGSMCTIHTRVGGGGDGPDRGARALPRSGYDRGTGAADGGRVAGSDRLSDLAG